MPFLPEPLRHALATGATVVTPNRRLARRIVALDDREQRNAGRLAWPARRVRPWDAWLSALWQGAVAAGAASYELRLQSQVQAAHAWRRIVAAHAAPLVDPEGAAVLAADAWETVHAWGEGGASWRSWEGDALVDEDCAAFARWASRYARALAADGTLDRAELGDRLCACLPRWPGVRGLNVVLAGFAELSPQQQRLKAALTSAGANVMRMQTLPTEAGRIVRASGETPDDEIA